MTAVLQVADITQLIAFTSSMFAQDGFRDRYYVGHPIEDGQAQTTTTSWAANTPSQTEARSQPTLVWTIAECPR